MPRLILKGGSGAEPEKVSQSPFFHQGVKAFELRSKDVYRFRILPSFDFDNGDPTTPAFKQSVIPYRDANIDPDPITKTEGFTSWYFPFTGYSFLGRMQKGFLSPANAFRGKPHAGLDPIVDCRIYCRKSDDPRFKALTETPKNQKNSKAVIPDLRLWAFINAYAEKDGVWENKIVYFSKMSLEDLKKKLSVKGGRNDKIITPAWENYLYGDVTDPMTGLIATARKACPYDNIQGIETSCLFFSKRPGTLEGSEFMPFDPATDEGRAILEARYDLSDTNNVTKIATYDDILAYIVEDGTIPYAVIQEACSPYANNIPPEPAHAREAHYSTPPPAVDESVQEPGQNQDAPAAEDTAPASGSEPFPPPSQQAETPAAPKSTAAATASRPVAQPIGAGKPAPTPTRTVAAPVKGVPAPAPTNRTVATPAVPKSAPVAKTHAALTPNVGGQKTPEGQARYEELVEKLSTNQASDSDFRELTELAKTYATHESVPAGVAA
jgi:hypothetical protein